jgi:hypothetical protein
MKLEISRQIFEKILKYQFHKHPSSGNRVVPCRRTDGQTDGHILRNEFSFFAILSRRLKFLLEICRCVRAWLVQRGLLGTSCRSRFIDFTWQLHTKESRIQCWSSSLLYKMLCSKTCRYLCQLATHRSKSPADRHPLRFLWRYVVQCTRYVIFIPRLVKNSWFL